MYRLFFKRFLDLLISLVAFLMLLPIFFVIIGILSITNNGSPLFFQRRPGRNENLFWLIKFKTMNDKCDSVGKLLPDSKRITRIGKVIRGSSLDEFPQLINVIFGQMSLVGPRPLLEEYLSLYNTRQKHRHDVRPGITGWAQVNGRNAISWEEKFEYDVWYVENLSFLLDVKIIVMTVMKVFKGEGISQKGHVTMEKFTGSN